MPRRYPGAPQSPECDTTRRRDAKAAREETRRLAKAGRLRPEEFGRLTRAAREDRHPEALALVLLLGEGGLRLGEAMGLQWGTWSALDRTIRGATCTFGAPCRPG